MELHEVPVEVRADIGVDGPVNLFALLAQTAQRFPDRGAVYHGRATLLYLAGVAGPRTTPGGLGRLPAVGHGRHRPLQTPQALPYRRPATEEQLRQGAQARTAPTTGDSPQ